MTSYTASNTKLSKLKDSATSNDTYVVGGTSKGLTLSGKSSGDTIQIAGLSTDYTFNASGSTLTLTNIANPKQVISIQLSQANGAIGDTLQFIDGNYTADYVPKVGKVKAANNITGSDNVPIKLSATKSTLAELDSTADSYVTSSSKLSQLKDYANSNDTYIVGTQSKGLTLNGSSNGDSIQINGLSTDYKFKASDNTLTLTHTGNSKQVITVQLSKAAGATGDTLKFTDGNITADYVPKAAHVKAGVTLTGDIGDTANPTAKSATLASLNSTFNPVPVTSSGKIADGYIKNATVFADENGDGIWNEGEAKATTDDSGGFTLTNGHGTIIASGGTDITSGLAFNGQLKAPEGSTTINPLTTLQQAFVAQGLTPAAAEKAVGKALGIDVSKIDLTHYDPIAKALDSNATAEEKTFASQVQGEAVKIANLLVDAGNALVGAAGIGNLTESDAFAAVVKSLINSIQNDTDGVISLTDTALLQNVLAGAVTFADNADLTAANDKIQTLQADFATLLADSAGNIDAAVAKGGDVIAIFEYIAQVGEFTQGNLSDAIEAGAAGGNIASIVDTYTGDNADKLIAATVVLQLDPDLPAPDPIITPVITPDPTPVITPDSTPVITPDPTPVITPVITPDPTPVITPDPTPVITPVITPDPTPVITPDPTPVITPDPTPVITPSNSGNGSLSSPSTTQTNNNDVLDATTGSLHGVKKAYDASHGDDKYVIKLGAANVIDHEANVSITGFASGDKLVFDTSVDSTVSAFLAQSIYAVSDNGTDLSLVANHNGTVQLITLVGMTGSRGAVGGSVDNLTELNTFLGGSAIDIY